MTVYHVNQACGCDCQEGSAEKPFATINQAAQVALPGDTVVVHTGVYRELVQPRWGGKSNTNRITYQAAPGEKVVIKGSEVITNWEPANLPGASVPVYRAVIPNSFFKEHNPTGANPFATLLCGDWLMDPWPNCLHTGDVYFDGLSMYESVDLEGVKNPKIKTAGPCSPWVGKEETIYDTARTLLVWHAEVDADNTTIYAHFGDFTPEQLVSHTIEINVRECCFAPSQVNTNYLTLEGFEVCQAATQWAPPTGVQRGMIDTYWSKGWIVRNCDLHDAKCSALSLGKEISTGDNESWRFNRKPGYQYQLEDVFKAVNRGWSFDIIGSHQVYNNVMHDCGQNGVVGHLGCIGSHIHHNRFYNIAMKHEFFGHEIAGIKLHAAIDVKIDHNEFHDCTLGIWLDWEAQGTQVISNVFYDNFRDLMIEVTHGPCVVANNIFASEYNFNNVAQGTALINNFFNGTTRHIDVLDRATPYHAPHSTAVTGFAVVYSGDDRVYGNVYVGKGVPRTEECHFGTSFYDKFSNGYEEFQELQKKYAREDIDCFKLIKDPVYIKYNAYLNDAPAFRAEQDKVTTSADPALKVYRTEQGLMMDIDVPAEMLNLTFPAITTAFLGETRLSECAYENKDGSPLTINYDLLDQSRDEAACHIGPIEGLKAGHNTIKIWD